VIASVSCCQLPSIRGRHTLINKFIEWRIPNNTYLYVYVEEGRLDCPSCHLAIQLEMHFAVDQATGRTADRSQTDQQHIFACLNMEKKNNGGPTAAIHTTEQYLRIKLLIYANYNKI
jgi:hypothetical protein